MEKQVCLLSCFRWTFELSLCASVSASLCLSLSLWIQVTHASSYTGPWLPLCRVAVPLGSPAKVHHCPHGSPPPDADLLGARSLTNTLSHLPVSSIFTTSPRQMSRRDNHLHFRDEPTDPERWRCSPCLRAWPPRQHPLLF